jgi:hypothetical protein
MKKELVFPAILLGLFVFSAQADIVIYTSGTGDAGLITGDEVATQTFTVRDASLTGTAPDFAWGDGNDVQLSGTASWAGITNQGYAVLSLENLFGGTYGQFITSGDDITSANLFMYQNGNGRADGSLTIRGLSTTASDWTESTATWNSKDGGTNGWDGAGGDINTQLSGSYGTTTFSDGSGWVSIDITAALKAYKDGTIAGLVLTTDAGATIPNLNPHFSFDSTDNSSGNSIVLQVDQVVPEPAAVSLIMIGGSLFYGARRHHKNQQDLFVG